MAELDNLSSQDLFNAAVPGAATEPEVTPAPAPEPVPQPEPTPPPVVEPEPVTRLEGIPSWRLKEEAEARRAAEDRARQLEERYAQLEERIRQSQKAPDFFENPGQATRAMLEEALRPLAHEIMRRDEETRRGQMYLGKMIASQRHGEETVDKAEQAFLTARENQTLDPADYERVVQSPNRFDAVVQWHKRQNVLASVGDDPNAWFERQLEARMNDPNFQAKVLEKVRADAASKPGAVQLPPSLSRVTAAAGNGGPGLGGGDKDLYNFATKD